MLEKIYQSHNKWINTTLKFGCNKEEAEDIVGNMYLIIGKMLNKGLNISYGEDGVNYYYIYLTLKTSFLQLKNKQKKEAKTSIDLVYNLETSEYIDYESSYDEVLTELDTLNWYDKKIYSMVMDDYSITELSNKTNISYHSIYNTVRKVKTRLKSKLK